MAISRQRKEELVGQYKELLESSDGFVVIQSQGMTVPAVQSLRKVMLGAGGKYIVTKNTLLRIALEQSGWTVPEDLLAGPVAVAFGKDNFPGVVKALLKYLDDEDVPEEKLKLTGGVLGGKDVFGADQVEDMSKLPTLPEVQSQILGLLVQPSQQLVSVLQQANSGVVNVLQSADTSVLNVLQAWVAKQESEGAA